MRIQIISHTSEADHNHIMNGFEQGCVVMWKFLSFSLGAVVSSKFRVI